MFVAEILGFWLVVGVAFFGWRRLANGEDAVVPPVLSKGNGHRAKQQ